MGATEQGNALNEAIAGNAAELLSKPLCFVISRIGDEGSPEREFANSVLKHVIRKALDSKYRIERADEIGKPGLITVQIIQRLAAAELVVADLTGGNANVYYELALRHYFAKPVVHIMQRGEQARFDVSPMRYVEFELKDPDSLDAAREEIQKQVGAMESGENVVTLVQVAKVMAEASQGKEGETVAMMKALYGAVGNVQQAVENVSVQVSKMAGPQSIFPEYNYGRTGFLSDLAAQVSTRSEQEKLELRAGLMDEIKRKRAEEVAKWREVDAIDGVGGASERTRKGKKTDDETK